MPVCRVEKNKNYTVMSNYHLNDKRLSYKAMGFLSQVLSLPDDWDYSLEGLMALSGKGEKSVRSCLKELEDLGYLVRERTQGERGRFEYIYTFYESPLTLLPCALEGDALEGHSLKAGQLNTNIQNTKEQNTKHIYGEYGHVRLTEKEFWKLHHDFPNADELIAFLDEYIQMKGYKAKDHNLAIRKWVVNAVEESHQREARIKPQKSVPDRIVKPIQVEVPEMDEERKQRLKEIYGEV